MVDVSGGPLADEHAVSPLFAPVDFEPSLPASKSIANRALLCAALANGKSRLVAAHHDEASAVLPFDADDVTAMVDACSALGARAAYSSDRRHIEVAGIGGRPRGGSEPCVIDAERAGTVARFVLPTLAASEGEFLLTAEHQLRNRPMGDLIAALRQLGANIVEQAEPGHLPLRVTGSDLARGPVTVGTNVSSQFLSGLLLAGPICPDGLHLHVDGEVAVSRPYVDMTVAVMAAFGATVTHPTASEWVVEPTGYAPTASAVEPDATAASYFFAAAAITGGKVRVRGLSQDSLQGDVAFAQRLAELGADVTYTADAISVAAPPPEAGLSGGTFDFSQISDTTQTLAAVACFAREPVTIGGIGFISAKESDRLSDTAAELRTLGVSAEVADGQLTVRGDVTELGPGRTDSHGDHRMAMALTLVGLRVAGVRIGEPGCVDKSFPGYFDEIGRMIDDSTSRFRPRAVVAIDGPAASGKSSVARELARHLGGTKPLGDCYLDTGAMYRCVAAVAHSEAKRLDVAALRADDVARLARDIEVLFHYTDEVPTCQTVTANGNDVTGTIRSPDIDRQVSAVAALADVRAALVTQQRSWIDEHAGSAESQDWVVVEGRDIASVVAPDAAIKLFLTASHDERARRRGHQIDHGAPGTERAEQDIVSADLVGRDAYDRSRAASPLRLAPGAVIVNTTTVDFAAALSLVDDLVAQARTAYIPDASKPVASRLAT